MIKEEGLLGRARRFSLFEDRVEDRKSVCKIGLPRVSAAAARKADPRRELGNRES